MQRPLRSVICCPPHVVVFFKESVVFNRSLLELHVDAAAVDADDASDATAGCTE